MNFNSLTPVNTKRLALRQSTKKDCKSVFNLRSNPLVIQYIKRPPAKNMEEAIAFIEKITRNIAQGKSLYWAIAFKEDPQMIGSICLWNFSEDRKTAELGYDLLPEYHQQGIMSESVEAILKFGFEELQLQYIEAYTHRDNLASINLLLKMGFHLLVDKKDKDNPDNIIFQIAK